MKKIRVGYCPYFSRENAYVTRNIEILERLGPVFPMPTVKEFIKTPFLFFQKRFDVTVVGWVENSIFSHKTGRVYLFGVLKFFASLILIKALSKKSVFVRHNNYPHHAVGGAFTCRIMDMVEGFFDISVTHSGHNERVDRVYVPHSLYFARHEKYKDLDVDVGVSDSYIIFGRISRYKKIENLIRCLNNEVEVVVVGGCDDVEYLDFLKKISCGKRVRFLSDYICEEDAVKIIRSSRGVIITHCDEDMVVSGSFFFALSCGVSIQALRTPFLNWVQSEVASLSLYDSLSELVEGICLEGSHIERLDNESWLKAFDDDAVEAAWKTVFSRVGVL